MGELIAKMPHLLGAHTRLAMLTLLAAVVISVPLGVAAYRKPNFGKLVISVASVVQTIPGLALLAIMVPLLTWLALPSIGVLPAFMGLTLYGVLPILQNTITGLNGLDPTYIEAARGVGMTPSQRLWQVELPLALPVIVAGIRTAAVWTVGMATLSTPIGAPSLGNYIFSGLQTRNYDAVLLGCIGSAALALFLDAVIRLLERGASERRKPLLIGGAAVLLSLAVVSAVPVLARGGSATIQIGAKTFTEQYILAEVLKLEAEAEGETAEVVSSLGSAVVFDALLAGEIDIFVEYSGTVYATAMHKQASTDRVGVLEEVRDWLQQEHQVETLAVLGFENTYALVTKPSLNVDSIQQLATRAPGLSIGSDYEFFERSEWEQLRDRYDLQFQHERSMDPALMYQAIEHDEVNVISAYSTDGRIAALGLKVLDDTQHVIPPYDAMIVVRPGFRRDYPRIAERLAALDGAISPERMRQLNREVDQDGAGPKEVAARFLAEMR